MDRAEKILSDKQSYDFLQGAKRVRVKVAMQAHTNQTLHELKENVTQNWIIDVLNELESCNTSEKRMESLENNILALIDEAINE